jgi:hypothetical protein
MFVGSDDATFVSLLASCQLHVIGPWSYMRDLFCLLPTAINQYRNRNRPGLCLPLKWAWIVRR